MSKKLTGYNRRQRKKLNIGEFQKIGLALTVELDKLIEEAQYNSFINEFKNWLESKKGCKLTGGKGELPTITLEVFDGNGDDLTQEKCDDIIEWIDCQYVVMSVSGKRFDPKIQTGNDYS